VYLGAQVCAIPFWDVEHQKAFSKSLIVGLCSGEEGRAGPKSPCRDVRLDGERRMLVPVLEVEGIGPSSARWVVLKAAQMEA